MKGGGGMARPQDKHLIPLTQRSEEEARAIRSAGGKASQAKRRKMKAAAELMQIFCDLPVSDGRKKNRLKRLGFEEDDLSNKALMVAAIGQLAQAGNVYAFEKVLELLGEDGLSVVKKENNLLEAIVNSTAEDVNTDDIPEIQQEADADADVVEQGSV